MSRVVLIHGSFGSPDENWFPWLKSQLEKQNINVVVPQFPIEEEQSFDSWIETFKSEVGKVKETDVLVGHSIGVAFILGLLEHVDTRITGCVLVSGFMRTLGFNEFDQVNKTFIENKIDYQKIKKKSDHFIMLHGDNDPYVPIEYGNEIAENLNCQLIEIENGGHLNEAAGYKEFPLVLQHIQSCISK
ncbi:MAG: alpha/beta hydrolase [Acidimicrobiia bacterium]